MTVALRRQIKELGDSVPTHSQGGRDQLWRNVATELNHRQAVSKPRGPARLRAVWMMGVVTCAILLVVMLPLLNQSHTSLGGYLLRTQLLEAAPRSDRGVVLGWANESSQSIVGHQLVASNAAFELWQHEDGMRFVIRHKSSGQMWSTSPDVRDARVSADQFGRAISPFSIRYGDANGRVDAWANPADQATLLEVYPISSGIGIRYVFDSLGIAVRLDYVLGDGYLEVSIPDDGIEAYGSYQVKSIELFPFFHVRDSGTENRVVMAAASSHELAHSLEALLAGPHDRSQLMFGVTGDDFGFLAEVVQGGDFASVHVDPSGMAIPLQRVYVEFLMGSAGLQTDDEVARTVRYHVLVNDGTKAVGLAELLQRHLHESRASGRTAIGTGPLTITG